MPEGFVYSFVADGVVAEFGSGERYVESRTVSFTRYIDNVPVYGNSRLAVSFDRELNITAVDSIYRPIVACSSMRPARDARKMLELAVKKGEGCLVSTSKRIAPGDFACYRSQADLLGR